MREKCQICSALQGCKHNVREKRGAERGRETEEGERERERGGKERERQRQGAGKERDRERDLILSFKTTLFSSVHS